MIQGKWFAPGESLPQELLSLRQSIFTRGKDALDPLSWNALIYDQEKPVAVGRIWWQDGAFRLGEIGVLPAFRGMGLGDLTLRLLLFKAQSHCASEVRLSCSPELTGFFSRLGFRPDPAAEGVSVEMLLPGDRIRLDSCVGCDRADCPNRS